MTKMNSFETETPVTEREWKRKGEWIGTDENDPQTIAYISDHRNRRPWTDKEKKKIAKLIASAPGMEAELYGLKNLILAWADLLEDTKTMEDVARITQLIKGATKAWG